MPTVVTGLLIGFGVIAIVLATLILCFGNITS